jgi:hypothetical protein
MAVDMDSVDMEMFISHVGCPAKIRAQLKPQVEFYVASGSGIVNLSPGDFNTAGSERVDGLTLEGFCAATSAFI